MSVTGTRTDPVLERAQKPPINQNLASLLRLIAVIGLIVAVAVIAHGLAVLVVILALIVMVMFHELGHFAAAKLSGMKVTEYFLGFGPRLWSIRRGETEYGVKAIPAGGYVRIVGMTTLETIDPVDEPRSFRSRATFTTPTRRRRRRLGDALHHGLRVVVGDVHLLRWSGRRRPSRRSPAFPRSPM